MTVDDMLTYYQIKLDEHGVKRVHEISVLREHAEQHGDTDKLIEYDQELNLIYKGDIYAN